MSKEKFCLGCNDYHSVSEFNKRIDSADGLATYCRKYTNEKQAVRNNKKKENKEYAKMFMPI